MTISKILITFLFIFIVDNCWVNGSTNQVGDQFYDNRCICVCPSFTVIGEEETHRKIYISILDKDNW
jgi:hypothetical protein